MTRILDQATTRETYQIALRRLTRAIALSEGQFSLILASCEHPSQQREIFRALEHQGESPITPLTLSPQTDTLISSLQASLSASPAALMVFGLESVKNLKQVLIRANLMRNEFAQQFPFPVILWVNPEISATLSRVAPDLKNWATSPITFPPLSENLPPSKPSSPPLQDWSVILNQARSSFPQENPHHDSAEIVILQLHSFGEITLAIQSLKRQQSVIIDLRYLSPQEAQRSLDFLSGGTYALNGDLLKIGDKLFLFTPSCVELKTQFS